MEDFRTSKKETVLDQYVELPVVHIKDGAKTPEDVPLIVEEPLEIRVNGLPYAVVMRTPGHEMELAAGFCLTEGIVDSFPDILSMGFCPNETEELKNIVQVIVKNAPQEGDSRPGPRAMSSRSSCGLCGVRMLEDIGRRLSRIEGGPEIKAEDLVRMQYAMLERQDLFRTTRGGAHAVALADTGGKVIVVREDLGRHNAMDKVIGHAMMSGIDCRRCVALISGRISFEMVQKAVRAKIAVVAAVSAATSLAVNLAERMGCTLVGRLRDRDMVVYTHSSRILE